jgi:predicted O-methyltransferase YrrM
MLLTVGPEVGLLLNLLARELKAKRILELGTSYGYSTILLAEAARQTGGRVISIDLQQSKQDYARDKLSMLGLIDHVELRNGDALEVLKTIDGPIDLVLVDLWKDLYVPCLELFYPRLGSGAVIVADNMIFPPMAQDDARAYRAAVRAKPHMQSMLLPVGQGIELSRYVKDLPTHLM